jgi:uncharacterized protein (TIGR02246 family)
MRLRIAGLVGVIALSAGTAVAQEPRAAIEAVNKQFVAAFAKHDAQAVTGFYSATAEAFPPNSDVVRGKANIAKMWQGVFDAGIATADLKTTEVLGQGPLAFEAGTYTMKLKDGTVADRGKYMVVWLKENGSWKLHRDIWNTNMPAPPPPKK